MSPIKQKNSLSIVVTLILILILVITGFTIFQKINSSGAIGENNSGTGIGTSKSNNIEFVGPNSITVLLVGRGGYTNDAPDLTDTMILAKINKHSKQVSLLSIPRDLYVKYPTSGAGKLNSIYATYYYRERKNQGTKEAKVYGMKQLENKITEITGEKIDYFINVDFGGFTKIIDAIGGIDINVEREVIDNKYPTNNWGYQTIVFRTGPQHMNGARALMFARSRKGTDGGDFNRSLRQQQVITAIKKKIGDSFLVESPQKVTEIYNLVKENVSTNISLTDAIEIILNFQLFKNNYTFNSSNMNTSCFLGSTVCEKGGVLYNPPIDTFGTSTELFYGTSAGNLSNYELANKYSQIVLKYPKISKEGYEINIFNGTKQSYLASNLLYQIERYGYQFPERNVVGNTEEPIENTIIYYNGVDENSDTIQSLKEFFKGHIVQTETPKYSENGAKIEIVLGADYLNNKDILDF